LIDQQNAFSESGTSPPRHVTLVDLVPGCTVGRVALDSRGSDVILARDRSPLLQRPLGAGDIVELLPEDRQLLACGPRRGRP
jgi:hypothetical protein